MKKGFGVATVVLIILVIIRTISQFVIAISSMGTVYEYTYFVTGIVYIIGLVGLFMRKKWGAILILIFAILDILASVSAGGASAFGAAIVDLVIMWLAYLAYKADIPVTSIPAPTQTENK